MRSTIPRPEEDFIDEHFERGRKRWRINRTWYRFLANLLTDAAATEADTGTPPPSVPPATLIETVDVIQTQASTFQTQMFARLARIEDDIRSLEVQPPANTPHLLALITQLQNEADHIYAPLTNGALPVELIGNPDGECIMVRIQ